MPDQFDALARRFGGTEAADFDQLAADASAAPAAESWPQQMIARTADNVGDVALGAVKGVGRSVVGLGRLAASVPGIHQIAEWIQPGAFAPGVAEEALNLNPTNTAQRVGMTGEQIAEFFLPASKVSQAA